MLRDLAPTIRKHVPGMRPPGADGPPDETPAATTTLLVLRHGHAGDREKWEGPDERRPLSKKGRRQAVGAIEQLAAFDVRRILSSRYVRCLETVVPVACDRGLSIEVHPALAEGSSTAAVSALVAELAGTTAVLCTHGDVVWNVLVDLAHHAAGEPDDLQMAKGSAWVVEARDDRLAAVRYLPPPTASS
jgi:8-oxo-(d)GTP phosphatase